jgi:hypothetical protein
LSMTDWWYSYEPWEKFIRTIISFLNPKERRQLTNVHTGILEGDEHVDIVGLGTNGSDDGRLIVSCVNTSC